MYKGSSVPADANTRIAKSGGTLVASYDAIGVVVARSLNDTFEAAMQQDARVAGVARSDQPVAQASPVTARATATARSPSSRTRPRARTRSRRSSGT